MGPCCCGTISSPQVAICRSQRRRSTSRFSPLHGAGFRSRRSSRCGCGTLSGRQMRSDHSRCGTSPGTEMVQDALATLSAPGRDAHDERSLVQPSRLLVACGASRFACALFWGLRRARLAIPGTPQADQSTEPPCTDPSIRWAESLSERAARALCQEIAIPEIASLWVAPAH
jgi:hypothetical protein